MLPTMGPSIAPNKNPTCLDMRGALQIVGCSFATGCVIPKPEGAVEATLSEAEGLGMTPMAYLCGQFGMGAKNVD